MFSEPLLERYELFAATATVAAHANAAGAGFRQRDVRFLVELFSNWCEASLDAAVLPVQNTQVLRYLESLVREGYCRMVGRGKPPTYRLTRIGLIELLTRVTSRPMRANRFYFFFLYFFVRNYRGRIEALVRSEGKQFPPALSIELAALVDAGELLRREIAEVKRDLEKIEVRINDAYATSRYAKEAARAGKALDEIVLEAQRRFPYELNSQKPLVELIDSIPADQRRWELEEGNVCRVHDMWEPHRDLLRAYLSELEKLSKR